MSLYNKIANQVAKRGLLPVAKNEINASIEGFSSGAVNNLGGGALSQVVGNIGSSMAKNAASSALNKYIPPGMSSMIGTGAGVLSDVTNGNLSGAGLKILDSGLLKEFLPGMSGVVAQQRYFNAPTPLLGGISPKEAKKIYSDIQSIKLCKKNLFLVEMSSNLTVNGSPVSNSSRFNMFVTEIDYAPLTITGEKKKIGGAHVDITNSSDPVELRLTTLDSQYGELKNWFAAHCEAAASMDGTVGLPDNYKITIKIVHGFINNDTTPHDDKFYYKDQGLFRPANMEISLSRTENGLQEIQLSFVQLDTFMRP